MNEIFGLRNISHLTRNLRDLRSWLPKTVYCRLETTIKKTTVMATTTYFC